MYRHPHVAEQAQVQALRADLGELRDRLDAIARERDEARAELACMREGIDYDPAIDLDPGFVLTRRAVAALGGIGVAVASAIAIAVLVSFFEAPLLTAQGLRNVGFHLARADGSIGIGYAIAAVVVASPWIVVPALAARGLRAHRVSGWFLALVACTLYLPTPLLPVCAAAISVLLSARVRRVYFPVARA